MDSLLSKFRIRNFVPHSKIKFFHTQSDYTSQFILKIWNSLRRLNVCFHTSSKTMRFISSEVRNVWFCVMERIGFYCFKYTYYPVNGKQNTIYKYYFYTGSVRKLWDWSFTAHDEKKSFCMWWGVLIKKRTSRTFSECRSIFNVKKSRCLVTLIDKPFTRTALRGKILLQTR